MTVAEQVREADQVEAGWTAAALGGRESLVMALPAEARDATVAAARRAAKDAETGHRQFGSREDFAAPSIARLMATVADRLDRGPGAVILTGLDVDALGQDVFVQAVAGLMQQLGELAPQSRRRDRVGYVQKERNNPTARGYTADIELTAHTDFHEIVALASIRAAPPGGGGESGLTSFAGLRRVLADEHPEVLPLLAQGFPHDSSAAGLMSDGPVPLIAEVDGVVSGYHQPLFMKAAERALGAPMSPELKEAAAVFARVANRPDVQLNFTLQPGEIMIWHNFRVMHARAKFNDTPEHSRLLIRFWVNPDRHVPLPAVFLSQRRKFDRLHESGETAVAYDKADAGLDG